jgi:hypothetical protein
MNPSVPKIALVTPSFNQAGFLEDTIRSVLVQEYPNLQYVVMDGGSTDGSVDIIKRYASQLHHWESAPDGGPYAAINRGFEHTDADIMGWLNSDDVHCAWTLQTVGEIMGRFPECQWLTTTDLIPWNFDVPGFCRESFLEGLHMWGNPKALGVIQQESTFWRRSLWEQAGGLDPKYPLAGDFALWARFFRHADLHCIRVPMGGPRRQEAQRHTVRREEYIAESQAALDEFRHDSSWRPRWRNSIKSSRQARACPLVWKHLKRRVGYQGYQIRRAASTGHEWKAGGLRF